MRCSLARVLAIFVPATALWLGAPAASSADPISSCNATVTQCDIYEDSLLDLGGSGNNGFFIAGDWILLDADGTISDVLRFFNNLRDTGGGTGLGTRAFLYSDDQGNLPATFSVNARRISEGPPDATGATLTTFTSNGTLYRVHGDEVAEVVPEPATFGLVAVGLLALRRLRPQD
jgi:hypothetical protein